jgi:hypothetical protein
MPTAKHKSLEDLLKEPEAQAFVNQHANMSARQRAKKLAGQHADEKISVSVKVPSRIGDALWKAMHERKAERRRKGLPDGEPYEKQDIVTQALEQWLIAKGYLKEIPRFAERGGQEEQS